MFFLCSLFDPAMRCQLLAVSGEPQENLRQPRIGLETVRCIHDPLNPAPGGSSDQGASPRKRRPVLVCVRSFMTWRSSDPSHAPLALPTGGPSKISEGENRIRPRALYPRPAQPRTGRFKRSGRLIPQEAPCSCFASTHCDATLRPNPTRANSATQG